MRNKISGFGIGLLFLLSAFTRFQSDPIPLLIGFYGDSPEGMELAIDEINQEGGFKGADGKLYQLEGRVSNNPTDLVDAVAVLAEPDIQYTGTPVVWPMPVFLLSQEAGLGLQNVQATVFRGITDQRYQYDLLAAYLVNELEVSQIAVIGEASFIDSLQRTASPTIQHFRKDTLTQEQLNQIPQAIFYAGEDGTAFLEMLRSADWHGMVIMTALDGLIPYDGVRLIGVSSWLPALDDKLSRAFKIAYQDTYDEAPDALAVAAYDLTWAVRLLITRVGSDVETLRVSMPQTEVMLATQGQIQAYGGRDLLRTAVIYEVLPDGSIEVLTRFDNE
ncbi:MAG: hypothetical protein K8I82_30685 [Anaerolineae bacterium]|nr:hypothetical protein [Anaerolineae bacterium]